MPRLARTDRHNNPTAFTTDLARQAGLRLGVDYEIGDQFKAPDGRVYYTARLLGDPIEITIRVIDRVGFFTKSGKKRWIHTAMEKEKWDSLSRKEKVQVIAEMYRREGGRRMWGLFKS